jgi:hypothetical protein
MTTKEIIERLQADAEITMVIENFRPVEQPALWNLAVVAYLLGSTDNTKKRLEELDKKEYAAMRKSDTFTLAITSPKAA